MLCLIGMAASIYAQNINGKLVNEQKQPLAYANVVLQQADSTFVKGETSNEMGSFRISKVSGGDYRFFQAVGRSDRNRQQCHRHCRQETGLSQPTTS